MNEAERPDWDAVRRDYVSGRCSIRILCARHGVSPGRLYKRVAAEGWPMRRGSAGRLLTPMGLGAKDRDDPGHNAMAPGATKSRTTPPFDRELLLSRLSQALQAHISLVETRLAEYAANPAQVSAAERERETRTLGMLVRVLEGLSKLDDAAAAGADPCDQEHLRQSDDELRRELEARIVRVLEAESADGSPS